MTVAVALGDLYLGLILRLRDGKNKINLISITDHGPLINFFLKNIPNVLANWTDVSKQLWGIFSKHFVIAMVLQYLKNKLSRHFKGMSIWGWNMILVLNK